jgi:hypothetical protein
MAYLRAIASKLMSFIDEMTVKCQGFGNELNNIANKSVKGFAYPEEKTAILANNDYKTYYAGSHGKSPGENWLSRANRTLDRNSFQRSNPQHYVLRQPKWLSTFSSDYYV